MDMFSHCKFCNHSMGLHTYITDNIRTCEDGPNNCKCELKRLTKDFKLDKFMWEQINGDKCI